MAAPLRHGGGVPRLRPARLERADRQPQLAHAAAGAAGRSAALRHQPARLSLPGAHRQLAHRLRSRRAGDPRQGRAPQGRLPHPRPHPPQEPGRGLRAARPPAIPHRALHAREPGIRPRPHQQPGAERPHGGGQWRRPAGARQRGGRPHRGTARRPDDPGHGRPRRHGGRPHGRGSLRRALQRRTHLHVPDDRADDGPEAPRLAGAATATASPGRAARSTTPGCSSMPGAACSTARSPTTRPEPPACRLARTPSRTCGAPRGCRRRTPPRPPRAPPPRSRAVRSRHAGGRAPPAA